jgi:hypothetical protein
VAKKWCRHWPSGTGNVGRISHWRLEASKGARNRPGPGTSYAIALVADFEERLASYAARRVLLAKGDTAALFGESVRTVERYHSDARELRKAVDGAKSRLDR